MAEGYRHTVLADSILRTLLYYDIFSYPLTGDEITRYLPAKASASDVHRVLSDLVSHSVVHRLGKFYSVQNNGKLSERRETGNEMAFASMIRATRQARLIGQFPFVSAVMISGSLSKGFMDEKSDLDFFIVTDPGRLWIARTLLVMYKRLVLRNDHKNFCVNYFVTGDNLEIAEKNLFTATELATLIPVVNGDAYHNLLGANQWLNSFFPNFTPRPSHDVMPAQSPFTKRMMQGAINFLFPRKIETSLKRITHERWKRLYERGYSAADFKIAFKSEDHVSKNHPRNFQKAVIEQYERKIAAFASLHNMMPGI